jgi:hypothetical protein
MYHEYVYEACQKISKLNLWKLSPQDNPFQSTLLQHTRISSLHYGRWPACMQVSGFVDILGSSPAYEIIKKKIL